MLKIVEITMRYNNYKRFIVSPYCSSLFKIIKIVLSYLGGHKGL